jgi:hypothetical protein
MPAPPWRANSLFTSGPRRPLNRDAHGIIRAKLALAARRRLITALHEKIGRELLLLLGEDGRLFPAHATLATRTGSCSRTVSEAFRRFRRIGLLDWVRRLIRPAGQPTRQSSNAYWWRPEAVIPEAFRCPRKTCREGPISKIPPYIPPSIPDRSAALAALQAVAKGRQAAFNAAWAARRG